MVGLRLGCLSFLEGIAQEEKTEERKRRLAVLLPQEKCSEVKLFLRHIGVFSHFFHSGKSHRWRLKLNRFKINSKKNEIRALKMLIKIQFKIEIRLEIQISNFRFIERNEQSTVQLIKSNLMIAEATQQQQRRQLNEKKNLSNFAVAVALAAATIN